MTTQIDWKRELREVSAGFYQLVRLIETRVLSRFQPASGA